MLQIYVNSRYVEKSRCAGKVFLKKGFLRMILFDNRSKMSYYYAVYLPYGAK